MWCCWCCSYLTANFFREIPWMTRVSVCVWSQVLSICWRSTKVTWAATVSLIIGPLLPIIAHYFPLLPCVFIWAIHWWASFHGKYPGWVLILADRTMLAFRNCGEIFITLPYFLGNQGAFWVWAQPMRDDIAFVLSSLLGWAHTQNDSWK